MFVKTQFHGILVNLDNVERITTERPAEHTVIIEAETPQGTRYNLATAATRPEADKIIDALIGALEEKSPIFDLEEYTAARMEREAGKRAAETRRKYQREHRAETQGRKVEKSDNGAALDWESEIADNPADAINPEGVKMTSETDTIKCDYPSGTPGAIICQTGEAIEYPDTWKDIFIAASAERAEIGFFLETQTDANPVCLGRYPTRDAARILPDLQAAVENCAPVIKMPEAAACALTQFQQVE